MAGITEEWHSKRRQIVKIDGVRWLKKMNTIKNGAAMYDFVEFEDYLGNVGRDIINLIGRLHMGNLR